MNALPAKLLSLMAVAAEMRVNGSGWNEIAARVGRAARNCRRWPVRFPLEWARFYLRAETPQLLETGREAGATLRKLMRDDDARLNLSAAKALFREHCTARDRFEKEEAAQATRALSPDDERALRTLSFLRGMSDEQFNAFVWRLLASLEPEPHDGGAEAEHRPGAIRPG
jgi:hypothetical protein